ncbi:MAG: Mur ligase family protein, partial [Phycisphaerales bacterium]
MTFEQLIKLVSSADAPNICIDSRRVKPGDCFVAVKGTQYDGHDFISSALSAGAKYVVSQKPFPCESAELIQVSDTSKAVAILAQARFGNPASKLTNLAVTGTNGKTTVAYLVRSVIRTTGRNCGLIGTVVYDTSKRTDAATLTTPDSMQIAQMQNEMVQAGTKYMIIEASSHALSQNRLAEINFTAAAFTNLTG